jgi:hypothetical protein
LAASAIVPVVGSAAPAHALWCVDATPGWYYSNVTKVATPLWQVGPTHSNYNGTPYPADMTLTSTLSGTVGISASISLSTELKVAILGGVKGEVSASVSMSLTATASNSFRITVPAHHYGNGKYGVFRFKTTGLLHRLDPCGRVLESKGYVTAYTPNRIGWYAWIS